MPATSPSRPPRKGPPRRDSSTAPRPARKTRTLEYLSALGPDTLQDRGVTVRRTAQTATVEVTGTVISVVPGLHLHVSESASGPVERYVPPEGD